MQPVALYVGSFDPVTNGHIDVVRHAAKLASRLVIAIGVHPGKTPLFSAERRSVQRGAIATIALFKPTDGREYEHLEVDAKGRIQRMRLIKTRNPLAYNDYPAAPAPDEPPPVDWYMYPGIMVMEPAIFDLIPKTPPWALFAGLYGPMVANRLPVFGYVHRGFFRTVDDLKAYQSLHHEFASSPPQFLHLHLPLSP